MTLWLTRLHRWIGLALAVPVVAVAATGTALVFHDSITLARLGPLPGPATGLSSVEPATDLPVIERLAGPDGWRTIKLPGPDLPLYRVWLSSGEHAYLVPGADSFIDRFFPGTRIESLLFEIHTNLLAGPVGEWLVGAIALLLLALLLIGLAAWWPARRTLRPRHFVPRSMTRRLVLRSHSAWGAVAACFVALSVATGAMLVFPQATLSFLSWVLPDDASPPGLPAATSTPAPIDWSAVIAGAERIFADDRLVFVSAPRADNPYLSVRTRRAAEWHPNGRTELAIDPGSGAVVAARDATTAGAAERLFHKIYPIHVARGTAAPLQPLTIVTGIVLTALAITGAWTWLGRRRRLVVSAGQPSPGWPAARAATSESSNRAK